jgi:3-phosphoglycerate kinase
MQRQVVNSLWFSPVVYHRRQTGTATDEDGIPDGWMGLDAGLKSRELFKAAVFEAKTILWNG